jgi:hypothetical protein
MFEWKEVAQLFQVPLSLASVTPATGMKTVVFCRCLAAPGPKRQALGGGRHFCRPCLSRPTPERTT